MPRGRVRPSAVGAVQPTGHPERDLLAQHPFDCAIDERDVDSAPIDRHPQRVEVGVPRRQFDVDARRQRRRCRRLQVDGDIVQRVQEGDAEVVGHDRAVEAPPFP